MKKKLLSIALSIGIVSSVVTGVYGENEDGINMQENVYIESSTYLSSSSSGGKKWYYNTGISLPRQPRYSKYGLLSIIQKGDIIYEKNGGFGITGHIAIVENKFYDEDRGMSYVVVIEAIDDGVVRSILDDERVDDKDATIYRVRNATIEQKREAVSFCVSQLGKDYFIDLKKNYGVNQKDWYCSELVWASYKRQGIDIETNAIINEPGITPRDIAKSEKVYQVRFK